MTTTDLWDALRVLDFVLGSFLIAVAFVVVHAYGSLYVAHKRRERAGQDTDYRGLLPRHVATVGASHIILTVATMVHIFPHFHEPFTWRIPVYGAAYLLGLWSLWDVLGHQRARRHNLAGGADPLTPGT